MPPNVKDKRAAPGGDGRRGSGHRAAAPREPAVPAVFSQTSRMHKVMTAVKGDDEFSVFSTSPIARQKDPVEVNPDRKPRQTPQGGGKLLRFFRGLIR